MEAASRQQAGDGFALLGDQPHAGLHDPLGFDGIADDLARLILDSRDSTPFTLGIEGAWGMGKSSLMGRLCERLAEEGDVTAVIFNAWTADNGGVLEGLVKTVLNQLDPKLLRRALRNKKLMRGARLAIGAGAAFLGLGSVVDTLWNRVTEDPRARNELRNLVEEAVGEWRAQRPELGERVLCVFVDDLDRCSPRGVLEVFEAMKLYLDVPGIVFVVGYDQDIVSDLVLREKGYSSEAIESRDYLEKFIQIVYRIPRAAQPEARALVDSLLEASGTGRLFEAPEREIVIEGSQSNPRRIKRFVNGFVLAYGLDPRWQGFDPQALIRAQLLQMYFHEFARMLERPAEPDAIEEFLAYREVRLALRTQQWGDATPIAEVLRRYGLAVPGNLAPDEAPALVGELEENVPVLFAALVGRDDFVSLIQSLAEAPVWPTLRAALARGEMPLAQTAPHGPEVAEWPLQGLRVLLVLDRVDPAVHMEETLWKRGASLSVVRNTPGSLADVRPDEYDAVVITAPGRGDPRPALGSISSARRQEVELPPVVFFAIRTSTALRELAQELDVVLVSDGEGLNGFLAPLALERQADLSILPYRSSAGE